MKQILRSPASWAWVAAILGIQALMALAGGPEMAGAWFEMLGLSREAVMSGKVWQVFSYGFLHGGWWHAGLNALFILVIGSRIELMAGGRAMTRVMLAGVAGGGLAHLLLGAGLLVGISGACLALLLFLTTLSPESRMLPLPVSGRSLGVGILLAELLMALINPTLNLPGLAGLGRVVAEQGMGSWFLVGHACHFGGGLAGWLCGRWLLRPRVTLDRLRRERARREAE